MGGVGAYATESSPREVLRMREGLARYRGLVTILLIIIHELTRAAVSNAGGPTWLVLVVFFGIYLCLYPPKQKKKV